MLIQDPLAGGFSILDSMINAIFEDLKICPSSRRDFIFSGNVWLTAGLITEAVIFGISGLKGYMTIDPDGFESGDDIEIWILRFDI